MACDRTIDWLIRGGTIIDGSGSAPFVGDVAVGKGRIVAVGNLDKIDLPDDRVIDARGLTVTPGLIDSHVHTDLLLLDAGECEGSLWQGVTTHIIGQDGISYAPLAGGNDQFLRPYFAAINGNPDLDFSWCSVDEWLRRFDGASATNVAYLVPHGTVRLAVMGLDDRVPDDSEIRRMQAMIEKGMVEGAIGVSTGLDYLPCGYATTDELIAIARAASQGGVFVTHMRDYKERAVQAIEETLTVGEEAKIPTHISHFNCKASVLDFVMNRRDAGADITFDAYPYLAGCTVLMLALPWTLHRGSVDDMVERLKTPHGRQLLNEWVANPRFTFDSIVIAHAASEEFKPLIGLNLPDAARQSSLSLVEFIRAILIAEKMSVGVLMFQDWRGEDDLKAVLNAPACMIASDGIYVGERPHPRGYGTFARVLAQAREGELGPIEDVIRRMTSMPAQRFHLKGRGLIREKMAADIAVFDLNAVDDPATYENGRQPATGLRHLLVNGAWVIKHGEKTGHKPGRALRPGD